MEGEDKKGSVGRGGRGAAIHKAMLSLARQPGTQPKPLVPPDVQDSGGVKDVDEVSVASGVSTSSGMSRGALIYHLIKQKQQKSSPSPPTPTPSGVQGQQTVPKNIGRGRSELLRALSVSSITSVPGAVPREEQSQDTSSQTSSLTETMRNLALTEPQEAPPVTNQGSVGNRFSGTSSWIRLSVDPDKAVFEYEVKFEPQVDANNVRFRLLNSQRDKLGGVKSFDGVTLWLPTLLPREITVLSAPHPVTQAPVVMKVVFKRRTSMDKCIQMYNVLFGQIMRILKMVKIGNNYYAPTGSQLVPQDKLEVWPGYVTAVQHREGGVMLCVDVSHRVLRTETCYEIMADIFSTQQGHFKDKVIKALVGNVVLTRYNNKTYRIDDVIFDQNANSTFTNSKGEEIRYIDYYKEHYNINIKDPRQPLLLSKLKKMEQKDEGKTKFVCLLPELCYMTGLTDELRSDFRVMKNLAQHIRISPSLRHASLRTFIKNVNGCPEAWEVLAKWGLTLDDDTLPVEGRVLPPETIYFGSREVPGSANADWGREAGRENVIQPVDLPSQRWLILFFHKDEPRALNFSRMMPQVTRSMGIQVGAPQMVRLPNDSTETYVNALKQHYRKDLLVAVVIFPVQREDRYSAVKRLACSELGLPTQCIISRTIGQENKLRSVTQKIALQINCKLGGELWALKIPMTGLMVCGIDVYHDPLRRGNSVVGFVASTNQNLTRWFSHAAFQHPADEIVSSIRISMLEALRQYHRLHHTLPRTIIVYRDGVSDGQLNLVQEHELAQLAEVFHNFENYQPTFSYIVVQKKINTRIFAANGSQLDNPGPGSVLDHTITKRSWYDFFLVSQHVRQSTVSPTHYVVVRDGGNLKVDNMQRLTYKLTHLYYNWPGTVRVPAPCQYAHKLAYLIGQNVRKDVSDELKNRLYFL